MNSPMVSNVGISSNQLAYKNPAKKLPNNSSVSFGMKLSTMQENTIQGVLDRCVFSKKDLIFNPDNLSKLKVNVSGLALNIKNFFTQDSGATIYGVCHELAIKAGQVIQQKFGNLHQVFIIKDKNFFRNVPHYFLGLSEKSNTIFKSDKEKIVFEGNQINTIINNSILIDPSFKIYEDGSLNEKFEKHSKDCIFDISSVKNALDNISIYPGNNLILGPLKDLAPEEYSKSKETLFFQFNPAEKCIRYTAINPNADNFTDITDELQQNLPKNHPLINFYNHIQNQID